MNSKANDIYEIHNVLQERLRYFSKHIGDFSEVIDSYLVGSVLEEEEYIQFFKLLVRVEELHSELFSEYKKAETQADLVDCLLTSKTIDSIVAKYMETMDMVLKRLDEGNYVNEPYLDVIVDFVEEDNEDTFNFDYFEVMSLVKSKDPYYVTWIGHYNVRHFKSFASKIEAMKFILAIDGLGIDDLVCRY